MEYRPSWLDRAAITPTTLTWERILWAAILVLAVFSRFYILGARVQSHDENSHVYYSWRFFKGQGFQHDPLMHGPLQFHLLAVSYYMFGDNDLTARTPAALFSIAAVMFLWFYRRYLGRSGALIAGVMMLISPYILFYGRYARNEAFIELFGVVMIWGILRYLETGLPRYMYIITLVNVLHFTSKETSFIYTAIALLFCGLLFLANVTKNAWPHPEYRNRFLLALIAALLLLGAVGGAVMWQHNQPVAADVTLGEPSAPPAPGTAAPAPSSITPLTGSLGGLFAVAVLIGLFFLWRGYSLEQLRADRSLSIIIVMLTLVLPQLAAFPVRLVGWKIPTNASEVAGLTSGDILHIAIFLIPLALLSVLIGLLWNQREWLVNSAIWYSLFTLFYTSTFTNGAGFFTGLVGSLGYWLEQQGVERGSQPLYYYGLIQVPVYEYLPMVGVWLAFGMAAAAGLRAWLYQRRPVDSAPLNGESPLPLEPAAISESEGVGAASDAARFTLAENEEDDRYYAVDYSTADEDNLPVAPAAGQAVLQPGQRLTAPVFALLGFWSVMSLLAFTFAGERMPWLTVHITLPAILTSGWALGRLVRSTQWDLLRREHGWLAILLLPAFFASFFASLGLLLGDKPPFQGQELQQLANTSTFLLNAVFAIATGAGLIYIVRHWPAGQFVRILALGFFTLLGVLTLRTSIQANYYNYDNANELLVYAHSAPGVKTALAQIEEISRRTTDSLDIAVAYDNETSYPYWWYLRNYPNQFYYGANPSRSLRDKPIILVGDANFGKIEPVVANQYDRFDYIRLWWPNQDYFDLTPESIWNALKNPAMRNALWHIWIDRDYTEYGKVTGKDMSLANWNPAARMRLYIRKDITAKLWNYGTAPSGEGAPTSADLFEGKHANIPATQIIGGPGAAPGQFQRPRDMAVAADGTLYVVDTDNHRVQHLSPDGAVLQVWGSFGDVAQGQAAGGQFNQPWGIGLGPDGMVYIADTWNHRVQKFTPDGQFVMTWGYFGQGEQPEAFWGPRDVAVDNKGRVFVTDTGNKRIVVFDSNGGFLTQFGEPGMDPGQLDEPVGLAVDADNNVYVVDTWNQRIQVFMTGDNALTYLPFRQWEAPAWYGQSLDNKPYIAVDAQGHVFIADPEGYRVLEFTGKGEPVRSWGDFGVNSDMFGMPASVAVAPDGSIWVVDAGNSRLMRFVLP
jgi:predicted membrane-bound mannosyltransferase/DNA-binding beta-propeller fold protein YncE